MNSVKPWSKLPVDWIRDETIKHFRWADDGSSAISALILLCTISHFAAELEVPSYAFLIKRNVTEHGVSLTRLSTAILMPPPTQSAFGARLTYDDLTALTGLSRLLVSKGLNKLESFGMIRRTGRSSEYLLPGLDPGIGWAKLPGRALMSATKTSILPFTRFSLRSKHELHAMKLYLYYASIRDKSAPFSTASFETIWKKTGVAERDIPTANSLLLTCGLLTRTHRDSVKDAEQHEANKYFMSGYSSLFIATQP